MKKGKEPRDKLRQRRMLKYLGSMSDGFLDPNVEIFWPHMLQEKMN